MDRERPRGRDKNVTGQGTGLGRRGNGLGTGPVGSKDGYSGRGSGTGTGGGRRITRGAGLSLPVIIIAIIAYLFGGGNLLGGGGGSTVSYDYGSANETSGGSFGGLLGGSSGTSQTSSSGGGSGSSGSSWSGSGAVGTLNEQVASGSREKYTQIRGDGKDVVTIMLYMCGTDLESRSRMATSDLQEMVSANISDNVNLIVYTGGCSKWNNNIVSSRTNQIYQVKEGGLISLNDNVGALPMTDPSTLSSFIRFCAKNFPADRNELILWDHGSGSVSGYGYDEKFKNSGSMTLSGISRALKDGGVTFDFVGFDACLMATAETGLMLDDHADYMIASEETEPGIGWYYTNWLTALSKNTSMSTLELGKRIVDDFVQTCEKRTPGQGTTLSVVDLAELSSTLPSKLGAFSRTITKSIQDKDFKKISAARSGTREFARSSRIDQVDLAHLAYNVGNKEGGDLAETIRSAVKYNRTSRNMTNAFGLSIYFPYQRASYVDKATQDYAEIGMDADYAKAIRAFASMETGGQAVMGGSAGASPIYSLFGDMLGGSSGYSGSSYGSGSSASTYSGSSPYGSSDISGELIGQLLGSFLGGEYGTISGLTGSNTGFLSDRAMTDEDMVQYLTDNHIDTSALYWTRNDQGQAVLSLPEQQWDLVQSLDLNLFYDDGEGYIDLGLDNIYSFDKDGNLVADDGSTWLAVNGQIVSYYHLDTTEDGDTWSITGRIPAFLNGERVNLIVVFDNETPTGYIAGAQTDYQDEEIEVVAKNLTEIGEGDTLDFICDFYAYDGTYQDSYLMGKQMKVDGPLTVSDVTLPAGGVRLTYRLTDIYNQAYWTESIGR
ncbi:MAG: clostripain-related cysteine peptidase [Eubacteriales bacterium]|nr:clostripain-related cysteine peptidase [Eubacteriales bacterium]